MSYCTQGDLLEQQRVCMVGGQMTRGGENLARKMFQQSV